MSLGDLDDAAIAFTTCIRIRPDFPWPYNNRGVIHHRQQRNDQAIEDYNLALARNPNYVEAWENLGIANAALGKTDQAIDAMSKAIDINSKYVPAYKKRAELYRARKQYPETLRDYDRLIDLTSNKAPLYLQRAEVYQALTRLPEAIQDYDRAIALAPRNPAAYFFRAGVYYASQNHLKAREDFSKVIELAPNKAMAYSNRAIINWLHLKEFDSAVEDWKKVASLEPKNPEPHRYIGSIHLGRGEYAQALDSFQEALDRKLDSFEAVWAMAQIDLWQGKPKEALAKLDPLVAKLASDNPETLNLRGDVTGPRVNLTRRRRITAG